MPRFVPVAEAREIPNGTCRVVQVGDREIAVVHLDGRFAAVENCCPHMGGPLGQGELKQGVLVCPWHGWRFDPFTGRSPLIPEVAVRTFPVKLEDGTVYVDLEGGNGGA